MTENIPCWTKIYAIFRTITERDFRRKIQSKEPYNGFIDATPRYKRDGIVRDMLNKIIPVSQFWQMWTFSISINLKSNLWSTCHFFEHKYNQFLQSTYLSQAYLVQPQIFDSGSIFCEKSSLTIFRFRLRLSQNEGVLQKEMFYEHTRAKSIKSEIQQMVFIRKIEKNVSDKKRVDNETFWGYSRGVSPFGTFCLLGEIFSQLKFW